MAASEADASTAAISGDAFSAHYTSVTKQILQAGVELERFSLNYRLESCHKPLLNKLIFFGTQEAGASCGLAFEVQGVKQFARGRKRPLTINNGALGNALHAAEAGSIVAASGSLYELCANTVHYVKARKRGFDTRSANRYVTNKLAQIDKLIAERDALVAGNPMHPAHERALIEGRILQSMRGAFVNEYAHFSADASSSFLAENMFFLLNASYNTVGAVAAGLGYKALTDLKLNGPTNILFTVSGAMAMGTPILCTAALWAQKKVMLHKQQQRFNGSENALAEIAKERALLEAADNSAGSLMPSFPSTQRLAIYTESNKLFTTQLDNETKTMQHLNKVALQNSLLGPVIGSLLMTQGILGTRGYYRYFPLRPRKQLDLDYKGAVCGTVGTGMAVVGTAAWLLASLSYEHRLARKKQLPEQLIRERLNHLDDLEQTIKAI